MSDINDVIRKLNKLRDYADIGADYMRSIVPVASGTLLDSIHVEDIDEDTRAIVADPINPYSGAHYGRAVDQGRRAVEAKNHKYLVFPGYAAGPNSKHWTADDSNRWYRLEVASGTTHKAHKFASRTVGHLIQLKRKDFG